MSRARPCGRPSTMSIMTTSSASPFWATRMAAVAPTNPLPTMVTRTRTGLLEDASRSQSYEVETGRNSSMLRDGRGPDAGLLEHQGEVVRLRGRHHGVVDVHQAVLDQAQERLVERLHPVEPALADDLLDLRRHVGIDDPVGHAAVVHADLSRRDPAAAGPRHK